MKINIQFGDSIHEISFSNYDIAFVGEPIDDRGNAAINYINTNVASVIFLNYVPGEFEIQINDNQVPVDDLENNLPQLNDSNVLIDATTIGFVELLLLLQLLFDINNHNFSILYIEPASYSKRQRNSLLHFRDFDLSIQTKGYEAVPGHALTIDNEVHQKVVFLCGFEAERMDRVIEDSEIISKRCKCIFGLPAFKPGWEMDSFANNIHIMKAKDMMRDIDFCGATNPMAVFDKLSTTYQGLDEDDQLFVVPLATKPMSIGACLFLASKPKNKVAVLYDHPQKKTGRGIDVGKWHLYNIT
ncbi:hypothetical protein [Spirosoma luteum]|uniref:hypothetical protein n=1 Tax=Spirosoma luteum TaxID=431553 RepID=UPI000369AAE4|nr:hypothetical protein [Spirosoma luteum]